MPYREGPEGRKRKGRQRYYFNGMVFCPLRLSHVAHMRCAEYQKRDGCHVGCPNAAKPDELTRLNKIRDPEVPREPGKLTIDELVAEGFIGCDAIRDAIASGALEAEPTIIKKDIRRRAYLVSRKTWEKFKSRGTMRQPDKYTIEELSLREKVSYGSIFAAIQRGALYAERREVKIRSKENKIRFVYLIAAQDWEAYRESRPKVFTDEFKQQTVQMIKASKPKLSALARELGISLSQLHKWKRLWKDHGAIDNTNETPEKRTANSTRVRSWRRG